MAGRALRRPVFEILGVVLRVRRRHDQPPDAVSRRASAADSRRSCARRDPHGGRPRRSAGRRPAGLSRGIERGGREVRGRGSLRQEWIGDELEGEAMDGRRRSVANANVQAPPRAERRAAVRYPPGPPRSLSGTLIYAPGRNPLAFFTNLARTYGDLVHVRTAGEHLYLVGDPRVIRDIFVTHQHQFMKGRGLARAKRLLGEGLLTSEGQAHV